MREATFILIECTFLQHTTLKEAGKKRRKHKDIDVRQSEDYKAYQREYQRKYRLAHPDYYNNRAKKKKEEKRRK